MTPMLYKFDPTDPRKVTAEEVQFFRENNRLKDGRYMDWETAKRAYRAHRIMQRLDAIQHFTPVDKAYALADLIETFFVPLED